MASVYHVAALDFLTGLRKAKAPDIVAAINAEFPGWGNNAVPMTGYSTAHHHVSLIVSRSMHDALPSPHAAYAWDYQHGFSAVMAWLENQQRTAKDGPELIGRAIDDLKKVMAD